MNESLVTLEQAKTHMLRTGAATTLHDADIEMKIIQASAIVMNYHNLKAVPAEWLVGSPVAVHAPPAIEAQTLLVFGELFEVRESANFDALPEGVRNLFPRDPPMA